MIESAYLLERAEPKRLLERAVSVRSFEIEPTTGTAVDPTGER